MTRPDDGKVAQVTSAGRRLAALAALAVIVSACGGPGDAEDDEAAASFNSSVGAECQQSWDLARGELGQGAEDTSSTEIPQTQQGEAAEAQGAPIGLFAVTRTLEACPSFEEWMAGARQNNDVLPDNMNRQAALEVLCDNPENQPTGPCQALGGPES